jgi:peptidoglycan DL-endopeptidase CwlO
VNRPWLERRAAMVRLVLAVAAIAAPAVATPAAMAAHRASSGDSLTRPLLRSLRRGMSGTDVARVQVLLGVGVSGVFGRATDDAVRAFQAAHGLNVDGEVGRDTWAAMTGEVDGQTGDVVLQVGSTGAEVSALQDLLGLRPTGLFDGATLEAVVRFQVGNGLIADGQVGHSTRMALLRAGWRPSAYEPLISRTDPVVPAVPGTDSTIGRRAAMLGLRYLGVRYVWGGEDPSGFDCSGLVQYVYAKLGVTLPRVASDQYGAGPHVARDQLLPGDLVFFDGLGHVGIFIGHGRFVHAPHTGTVVQVSPLAGWYDRTYVGATRVW